MGLSNIIGDENSKKTLDSFLTDKFNDLIAHRSDYENERKEYGLKSRFKASKRKPLAGVKDNEKLATLLTEEWVSYALIVKDDVKEALYHMHNLFQECKDKEYMGLFLQLEENKFALSEFGGAFIDLAYEAIGEFFPSEISRDKIDEASENSNEILSYCIEGIDAKTARKNYLSKLFGEERATKISEKIGSTPSEDIDVDRYFSNSEQERLMHSEKDREMYEKEMDKVLYFIVKIRDNMKYLVETFHETADYWKQVGLMKFLPNKLAEKSVKLDSFLKETLHAYNRVLSLSRN